MSHKWAGFAGSEAHYELDMRLFQENKGFIVDVIKEAFADKN
jgi:hypothetical protein